MPSPADLKTLELGLRKHLRGKTVLGEVAFDQAHCDITSKAFGSVFRQMGVSRGLAYVTEACPATFALWLVNEAFYSYDGGYWTVVLPKVGVDSQPYSAHFGVRFLDILDQFKLPRFKKLNTHWSYLGPILAHCGIPRSRLPQFFEEVLPIAAQIGVSSADGLAELQQRLPTMHVSRSIEWFIRFGDRVSADFVRRCVDMYRASRSPGALPDAAAFGLPERVWHAFDEWRLKRPIGPDPVTRMRRPRLLLEPSQGVRLELPAQACDLAHPYFEWDVHVDGEPVVSRRVARLTGDDRTQADEVLLSRPFSSMLLRLKDSGGTERATWVLAGLRPGKPVLFFEPSTLTVMHEEQVSAGAVGMLVPAGHAVHVQAGKTSHAARKTARIGALPFGWSGFEADVFDLSGTGAVLVLDADETVLARTELGEQALPAPRLEGRESVHLVAPDRGVVFEGSAPELLLPGSLAEVQEHWQLRIQPVSTSHTGAPLPVLSPAVKELAAEQVERDGRAWVSVPLSQPRLIGGMPWGVFELTATGPLGCSGRFRFSVVPSLVVTHEWADWTHGRELDVHLQTRASLSGHTLRADSTPGRFTVAVTQERTPLKVACEGYGGRPWAISMDLRVPMPSWTVFDQNAASHLAAWATKPMSFSLQEADGRAPILMARVATPWGVPTAVRAFLEHQGAPLLRVSARVDSHGVARVDLIPFLAAARQAGCARAHLRLELDLARTVTLECLRVERHWSVDGLEVRVTRDELRVRWREQVAVQGRVLRAYPLLTPWEAARSCALDAAVKGEWRGPLADLTPHPGRYRVELGIEDDWAGTYEPIASCECEVGAKGDWLQHPLALQDSVPGVLFRLLVSADTGAPAAPFNPRLASDEDAERLATMVLQALGVLRGSSSSAARQFVRLLDQVSLWAFLRGVVQAGAGITSRQLLEFGVLGKPRGVGASIPLSDTSADALWRMWLPLGAWADMHGVVEQGSRSAQVRLERWLGEDTLVALGPVRAGARIMLRDQAGTAHGQGSLVSVDAAEPLTSFDLHALKGRVDIVMQPDGNAGGQTLAVRDGLLARADEEPSLIVDVRDRHDRAASSASPEPALVDLVRRGNGAVLRTIQAHCHPYPTSPIGGEAFQAACFEWVLGAADQLLVRERLSEVAAELAPVCDDVRRAAYAGPEYKLCFDAVLAELRHRTHPRPEPDPLFALHQASWLVATALVWRSLARPPFVSIGEQHLARHAVALHDAAPTLFAHDLTKACAIIALLAHKAQHAPRPSAPDDGTDRPVLELPPESLPLP